MLWPNLTKDQWELLKNIGAIIGVGLAIGGAATKIGGWARPRWREWRDRKTLHQRVGAELYDAEQIRRSTEFYVRPDCQSVDPAGTEDFRYNVAAREPLFDTMDRLLHNPSQYKFVILLADSGMGKTSFLLNYYAHHQRSRRNPFQLSLVPLNLPNSDELVKKTPEDRRPETALCLDALDEDRQAILDHRARLGALIELTRGFKTVIITCRSQFFPKEEEIPTETGVLKVGPIKAGEARDYYFHKLYLAPFTDEQVEKYLRRRFPVWRRQQREQAHDIVNKIPDLVARPMLLAHVPDLVDLNRKIDYSFQIYEAMIAAWLEREQGLVKDSAALRQFSELLAVDLFVNRGKRQMERIPRDELKPLADQFRIPLEEWQLSGRSLLNRDALGNYKFAHRSIMEYLFVRACLNGTESECPNPWTDLMKSFLLEMIRDKQTAQSNDVRNDSISRSGQRATLDVSNADLSGVDLSGTTLVNCNLSGAKLSAASLQDSNFRRAIFSEALLDSANLTRANLSAATFDGTNLRGANLFQADLSNAEFHGANLDFANLRRANLDGAKFSAIDLKQVRGLTLGQVLTVNADIGTIWPSHTRSGHSLRVRAVSVSLNGKTLISASDDASLKVWDLPTVRQISTLRRHNGPVNALSWSNDGNTFASASGDRTAIIWDLASGREKLTLAGHIGPLYGIALSPDGKTAISASWDGTLKIWDLATGRERRSLVGHSYAVNAAVVTPDGQRVMTASADETVKVWDLASGRELLTFRGHSDCVRTVATTPDGMRAVTGSDDETLKVWDASNGQLLLTLSGHSGIITAVVVTPNGQSVISGSADGTLKVWDLSTGRELLTLPVHSGIVTAVAVTPDGQCVISGAADGTLKVWFPPDDTPTSS